jgi:uncharacterized protein YheU (UPF0270 family)
MTSAAAACAGHFDPRPCVPPAGPPAFIPAAQLKAMVQFVVTRELAHNKRKFGNIEETLNQSQADLKEQVKAKVRI